MDGAFDRPTFGMSGQFGRGDGRFGSIDGPLDEQEGREGKHVEQQER